MFLCLLWNLADSFFNLYAHNWMQKTELHLVQIQDLRLRDFWYSLLQTVCRFWLRSIDLCPFKIGWNVFLSSILVLIQMPFMIYLCYILTAWKLQKYVVKTQDTWLWKLLLPKKCVNQLWGDSALGLENLIGIRMGIELHFYF